MLSVAAPLVVTMGTVQEARKVYLIPEYTLEEEVGTRQTDRLASWLGPRGTRQATWLAGWVGRGRGC